MVQISPIDARSGPRETTDRGRIQLLALSALKSSAWPAQLTSAHWRVLP